MEQLPPRVLIFPLPAQGHVNPMLKLAELLALAGLHVTFLNTFHIHDRLLRNTDILTRFQKYPGFVFKTITDGFPEDHPREGGRMGDLVISMAETTKPILKDMLVLGKLGSENSPWVSCIIADGIFGGFITDVAEELRIPIIHFRTGSACCFWSYFFFPNNLIENGELPIKGKDDMDRLIKSVPGMESFLRCRDLPGSCRESDTTDPLLHFVYRETNQSPRANALILNTFEDLDGPIISYIRTKCPKPYTVGPLHLHLKLRLDKNETTSSQSSANNLFEVDRSCMTWLEAQPPKSVIYVSFGSVAVVTKDDLMEIWHGLVNSNKRFLWVIRPGLVVGEGGEDHIPAELMEATRERGLMVGWVPQEEVLAHEAVGCFLTHSGWNSTLESIVAGVPMICWPYFADQKINSRYVGEVWKLGMDMKDVCDRKVVEKMVNDLMGERKEEFLRSTAEMARLAKKSVNVGGSSYCNLDQLVEFIRSMPLQGKIKV
ncbi:hypothetical protein UlMin_025527 [Ulmus minor]